MKKIITILLAIIVLTMTGCSLTGSSHSDSTVGSVPQTMPTGNANMQIALELPDSKITPSLRAAGTGTRVHVALNIVINGLVSVVRRVVPVVNGSATFNFQGLPEGSTLGEIHIEGGSVGGYNDFHGAIDLGVGSNTLNASPIGSGMNSDVMATVFREVIQNAAIIRTRTRNIIALITQVTQETGLATQTANIFEKLVEHVKPVGTILVRASADNTSIIAYSSTSSQVWTASPTTLFKDISALSTALPAIRYSHTIRQGFDSSLLVAWKDTSSDLFIVSKLNSTNGTLDKYLINRGSCFENILTSDMQLILGGYYAPKKCPIVMKWSTNIDADTGASDTSTATGLVWVKSFINFAYTGTTPSVRHLSFGAFSGLTAIIDDGTTHRTRHIVMSLTDGSYSLPTPPQKFSVNAIPSYEQNTIAWEVSDGSTYNIYWSLAPNIATSTATAINAVVSPYKHVSIENGKPVYYLIQETNSAGTIATSYEVSATPDATLNLKPFIGINSPINGQSFLAGSASITVSIFASDPDGYIASLSLILDGAVVGNLASGPFSFDLGTLTAGDHTIRAITTDNRGVTAATQLITFKVITDVTGDQFTNKITGHLKDDRTQEPIAGALVGIPGTQVHAVTDATGYFALEKLAPGIYTIIIDRDGYAKRTIPGIRVE